MNDSNTSKSTVTIKKYANRRLYNTATSSYVTLEDLSAMVKEGIEFNVYDAKTSEDITRSVLTQIIVEEEGKSGQQNLLPIGFLRQLISFYGDNMQWMVPKYLEHSMQMLSQNQEQIKTYFQSAFGGMFPFGSTFEEMGKQNLAMFERTMTMFTKMSPSDCAVGAFSASETDSNQASNATTANNPMWNLANCFMNACATSMPATAPMGSTKNNSSNDTPSSSQNKPASTPTNTTQTACTNNANASQSAQAAPSTSSDNVTPISTASTQTAPSVPMTNVKNAATNNANAAADDMQQKIANLQRQLADLAKNRA